MVLNMYLLVWNCGILQSTSPQPISKISWKTVFLLIAQVFHFEIRDFYLHRILMPMKITCQMAEYLIGAYFKDNTLSGVRFIKGVDDAMHPHREGRS